MKTGTTIAVILGSVIGVAVVGGAGYATYRAVTKGGDGGSNVEALKLEQLKLEQQKAAADAAARIAEANAAKDIAKTQAKAADKPFWEIAAGQAIGGALEIVGNLSKTW